MCGGADIRSAGNKLNGLVRSFPVFSEPELQLIYDRFVSFVRVDAGGAGIDFVSFQKLLPFFCSGWFHEMVMALFSHLDTDKRGFVSLVSAFAFAFVSLMCAHRRSSSRPRSALCSKARRCKRCARTC